MKATTRLFLFVSLLSFINAQTYDLVLKGGRVMDPESGLDAIRNVAIRAGKIAAISAKSLKGAKEIDAKGLVVAPGFIDLHSHGQTPENYRLKARDGVTTALELEIGVSSIPTWYAARESKALIHFGASVGHVPARMAVMKDTGDWLPRDNAITKIATRDEQIAIRELLRQGLKDGGLGIGFGFSYTPKAGTEELQELFELAGQTKSPTFIHMGHGTLGEPGIAAALHEVIAMSAVTGAPVHVVHIGASSTSKFDLAMKIIDAARSHGIDITTEAYPYIAGMTRLETAIFDPGFQEKLGITYKDMMWVETGERMTAESFAKYRKQGGLVATFTNTEEMIRKVVAHPRVMIASDGIMENGKGHPRAAGSYARVLGLYVREQKLLPLMDALRKISLMPAQRLESISPAMRNKGRIKVGADADLALFDPAAVIDKATYEKPNLPSEGIPFVVVGGEVVVRDGKVVEGVNPGKGVRTR